MKSIFSIMPEFPRDPDSFFPGIRRDEKVKDVEAVLNIPASEAGRVTPLLTGGLCVLGIAAMFTMGGILIGNLIRCPTRKDEAASDPLLPGMDN